MHFNSPIVIIAGLVLIALLLLLIFRNKKDKKELENQLNQDYHKPPRHPNEEDPEDVKGD